MESVLAGGKVTLAAELLQEIHSYCTNMDNDVPPQIVDAAHKLYHASLNSILGWGYGVEHNSDQDKLYAEAILKTVIAGRNGLLLKDILVHTGRYSVAGPGHSEKLYGLVFSNPAAKSLVKKHLPEISARISQNKYIRKLAGRWFGVGEFDNYATLCQLQEVTDEARGYITSTLQQQRAKLPWGATGTYCSIFGIFGQYLGLMYGKMIRNCQNRISGSSDVNIDSDSDISATKVLCSTISSTMNMLADNISGSYNKFLSDNPGLKEYRDNASTCLHNLKTRCEREIGESV